MDNNNYNNNNSNNNQSSDSFYSYNTNRTENSENQSARNPYQQNPYQQSSYQNTRSGYEQNTGYQNNTSYQGSGAYQNNQTYQSGTYQTGNTYQNSANTPKPPKKKRERKSNGFGKKLMKCAALALVFGLVAGGTMTGVNYASGQLLGTSNEQSNIASNASASVLTTSEGAIQPTATSSTYVAVDISDLVDEVMPSIVAITNISVTEYQSIWGGQSQTYESTSCGSGIIVSQDDEYLYIATNNHVVDGANTLTVQFNDDSTVSAEIKGTDPSTDLAVVRVALSSIEESTMNEIKVATLGDSEALRVGEASIAIGNALGYGQSVTTGVISALDREVSVADSSTGTSYTAELIQTDAAINPGNSGGALLNAAGEVIGINSVKYSDTEVEGIGYAIPISTAAPIIEELITKEKVAESESAYLGVAGVDVTSDVAERYNMPTGVYVHQVMEGSAAAQYGILQGDIITSFDGKEITTMQGLSDTLTYYAAGTTVEVVVQRADNGRYVEETLSIVLGKKN